MATTTSHNKKSSAVKRILSEARELKEPTAEFAAYPLDDNIFEWHFTLRGPSGTEFEQGYYHGRVILPPEYPFRPPDVMILTPNGRWELNKKICLTFTGFHEEMWQPAWGIRTALIGVQAFMGARAEAAVGIGSLDYPPDERERLARLSSEWRCPVCQRANRDTLPTDEGQPRIQESLPEGLTVDTAPRQKAEEKQQQLQQQTESNGPGEPVVRPAVFDATGGAADARQSIQTPVFDASGPSAAMLEHVVRSRLEAATLQPSISSSQVSTPGRTTPQPAGHEDDGQDKSSSTKEKGKEREHTQSNFAEPPAPAPSTSSPRASRPTPVQRASSSARLASFRPRNIYRHARHPSSAEASAQRLAALDRAIATVICLLAALVIRRLLNAWS